MIRLLGGQRHGRGDLVADADGGEEAQVLAEVDRAGTGQRGPEQRRNEPAAPHAVGDDAVEQLGLGVGHVEMGRDHVAGHDREQVDVAAGQHPRRRRGVADREFVEGAVGDRRAFDDVHDRLTAEDVGAGAGPRSGSPAPGRAGRRRTGSDRIASQSTQAGHHEPRHRLDPFEPDVGAHVALAAPAHRQAVAPVGMAGLRHDPGVVAAVVSTKVVSTSVNRLTL